MASTYLTRTPSSTGNQRTFTFSFWVKRGGLSSQQHIYCQSYGSEDYQFRMEFTSSDEFRLYNSKGASDAINLKTNRKFRDTSSWYAITIAIDTTQSTAANRAKIYVNGVQETSFATATYPTQNLEMDANAGVAQLIGVQYKGSYALYFDGSMSHFHFADGTAYPASTFGSTDATTGEWKINTSPSITMGNNGFTILKDGNTITDQSTNSNDFSLSSGTLTKTEDCPSNVFPTINPLTYSTTKWNIINGNLKTNGLASGESAAWRSVYGTLGASSGKYYFEMKVTKTASDPNNFRVGIVDAEQMKYAGDNASFINESRGYGYQGTNGNVVNGGANTSYGNSYTANDIIGCAFDLDNHKIYFSKNGTWQNSGDPTSGATGTGSALNLATGYTYLPAVSHYYDDDRIEFNFGNGYFGTTAVASAGTNASGIGIFEYDVPTGYTALSTKGLNL